MIVYDLIAYDVWGNEEDGWSVNDAIYSGVTVEVPPDATDTQILAHLYDDETLARVEVDPAYCDSDTLYIRVRGNQRPVGELRPRR